VVFSTDLEELSDKLFDNKVPDQWIKVSYPSVKPLGSYINDFIERLAYMARWIQKGKPGSFWISGFFFTQSFLTGVLQNFARAHKLPIDTLQFDFAVRQELVPEYQETGPEDGCYCHGLFLDGAKWSQSEQCLEDPAPRILTSEMPLIWFRPTNVKQEPKALEYICPVYKTSQRRGVLSTTGHSTNFVLSIKVPIMEKTTEEFWIKRGTALITQLDD
jgi:dynein heavy chain